MEIRTDYKPVVRANGGDLRGAMLVGANSAIIGWNIDKNKRPKNLMGFAVRRTEYDPETQEVLQLDWLNGQKHFSSGDNDFGSAARSDQAPFQRFRWSDYTIKPSSSYRYDVYPMLGQPGNLERGDQLTFNIRPSDYVKDGIGIYANRGVTAAMAYLDRFKGRHPEEVPNGSAFRWLERGLKKSLIDFIANAKPLERLHVCIYEFFDEDVVTALKAAKDRDVTVHIVYHAKAKDHATHKNDDVIRDARLKGISTGRTNVGNISHNKFIVHLKRNNAPKRLWTASANFSTNAFYFQTNVALVFDSPDLAGVYEAYYQILANNPKRGRKKAGQTFLQDEIDTLHAQINVSPPVNEVMFSPVRNLHVVDAAINLINEAKSAIFLSAPFGIGKEIVQAIEANNADIIEYGLANSTAKKKIEGLRRRNTRFFTPTRLKTYMGRKWDAKAFGAHKIHAKTLVIDPWGDSPAVLIGSANFSEGSCKNNDENTLLIRGDKRFSAIIATEFLRMYDHYKSRFWIDELEKKGVPEQWYLNDRPSWSDIYFRKTNKSRKFRDREVFSGDE